MPRVSTAFKADRRAEILAAAQGCFSRSGFHQTSMQEICAEAKMSPGNLYRYFPSKEAIIAGIAEQNRADAAQSFAAVMQSPEFFQGLAQLARHHLVDRTQEEIGLCAEIMAESRRNPAVARIFQDIERDVKERMAAMLRHAAERKEIAAGLDHEAVATALMVLADGMSWRRSVDPSFDAETILPLILQMVKSLLTKPTATPATGEKS
jgi:TetR/AcrR family transcriptional regulator, repressor for uid operon